MLWESKLAETAAEELIENVPLPFYEQRATLVLQSHDVVAEKIRLIDDVTEGVQNTALAPGSLIDEQYELIEIIGRGGMTIVYVARDTYQDSDNEVAIKILNPRFEEKTPELVSMFEYSIRMNKMLTTDRFPEYRDSGVHAGYEYVVNEYIRGANLEHILYNYPNAIPLDFIKDIGIQLCYAIQDLSLAGMVHRDIKPSNVMLTNKGEIKLLDFDLIVFQEHYGEYESNELLSSGTATYMSPEQCSHEIKSGNEDREDEMIEEDDEEPSIDSRSDIYNLGATLYQLATKRPPFRYLKRKPMLQAHMIEAPAPLTEIPKPLSQIIMKALEKDPENRFQSAAEMRRALENLGH